MTCPKKLTPYKNRSYKFRLYDEEQQNLMASLVFSANFSIKFNLCLSSVFIKYNFI